MCKYSDQTHSDLVVTASYECHPSVLVLDVISAIIAKQNFVLQVHLSFINKDSLGVVMRYISAIVVYFSLYLYYKTIRLSYVKQCINTSSIIFCFVLVRKKCYDLDRIAVVVINTSSMPQTTLNIYQFILNFYRPNFDEFTMNLRKKIILNFTCFDVNSSNKRFVIIFKIMSK